MRARVEMSPSSSQSHFRHQIYCLPLNKTHLPHTAASELAALLDRRPPKSMRGSFWEVETSSSD